MSASNASNVGEQTDGANEQTDMNYDPAPSHIKYKRRGQ